MFLFNLYVYLLNILHETQKICDKPEIYQG
jgi:hypothetical protein